jgi:hydroxymethylbilane synthase
MAENIVLGTRGSELALAQARMVESALREKWSELAIETRIIKTSGDQSGAAVPDASPTDPQTRPSRRSAGRKGLFTREIERALISRNVDAAVHSAKDLPSELTPDTEIAAVLARAPADDVLVSAGDYDLHSLPRDGLVATGSVRRKHQLGWKRPDLEIAEVRGNVPTRLNKLIKSAWHGIILARAGLERLGLQIDGRHFRFEGRELSAEFLPREIFLPAGGQGVIAIQIRRGDDRVRMLLESINHFDTRLSLRAEREFLRLLQADCNQPVGVYATIEGSTMIIRGQFFDLKATKPHQAMVEGPSENAEALAAELLCRIHGE